MGQLEDRTLSRQRRRGRTCHSARRDQSPPGAANTDFGSGFYTTTSLNQAQDWSVEVAQKRRRKAALVKVTIDRLALRSFKSLAFVRGTDDATQYWSFVEHCRTRAGEAPVTGEYYDVVYGPVAMRWGPGRYEIIPGMDQISFHGPTAQKLLRDPNVCNVEVMV